MSIEWPIHEQTARQIKGYLVKPAHGLMIFGLEGSGKFDLAKDIAIQLLAAGSLDNHPYFMSIQRPQDKQEISIDEVRRINKFLQLKVPGKSSTDRVVIIRDGQHMSVEAQNAFLKMLEEPAEGTVLIMTVDSPTSVLPTVASRAQKLAVLPVGLEEAAKHYHGTFDERKVKSAWQLSRGAPSLLHALLHEDNEHLLKRTVDEAKDFLAKDPYGRLIMLDAIAKNKEELKLMLDALLRITGALQRASVEKGGSSGRLLKARKLIDKSIEALESNASPRLVAQNLMLNLPI